MVKCKFTCVSKREFKMYSGPSTNLYDYEFSAVTNGSDENKKFWQYTPSGKLNVSTVMDDQFRVGSEYYIELSEAN